MERAVHDVLYARCADMASFAVCQHKLSMLQQPSSHTRTQFHTQWPCGAHPMEHASLVGAGLLSQLQALGLLTTRNTPPRRAVLGRAWGGGAAGGHHPAGTAEAARCGRRRRRAALQQPSPHTPGQEALAQFSPGSIVSSPGPMRQAAPVMPIRWPTHSFSLTSSSSDAAILARSQSSMMKSSHTS
jgi:hypothetical protein